jgi:hypothetical protein
MAGGKRRYLLSTAFVVVLLYIVFFPRDLGKELLTVPVWSVSLGSAKIVTEPGPVKAAIGFRLGKYFGSVRPDGTLLYRDTVDYDVALGESFFLNYSAVPRNLVAQDQRGNFLGNIGGNGYPLPEKAGFSS